MEITENNIIVKSKIHFPLSFINFPEEVTLLALAHEFGHILGKLQECRRKTFT